jgi:hypothetical protein
MRVPNAAREAMLRFAVDTWLPAYCLGHASADAQPAYGHQGTVGADRSVRRSRRHALRTRRAQEADELAFALQA